MTDDVARPRLADEPSLYLRQHAANPVDWWPWCDAAIAEARRRDVPILVSIGYATCYWCHVMERESFEDPALAEVLNARYVSIKVDREQRPDLDDVHMAACQVFTRLTEGRASGGWPLNAFLHPHTLEPFFVGTYFPPRAMHGRPAFRDLARGLAEAWQTRRPEVDEQASRIGTLVRHELAAPATRSPIDPSLATVAAEGLLRVHDAVEGGFGGAPKFPQPVYLDLLLHESDRDARPFAAVRRTLDRISVGGIHDHLGGGIHRYAVDGTWTVPHFEKMLYDQAQLASVLAASVSRQPDPWLERMLRRLVAYLDREMTEPDGCLRSAQDAEVDAMEGASFLWTPTDLRAAIAAAGLGDEDAEFAISVFSLDRGPNFRDPHHPEADPSNVLRLSDRPERLAAAMGGPTAAESVGVLNREFAAAMGGPTAAESVGVLNREFLARLDRVSDALLAARSLRPQPATDTKVIASWNGLAIRGLVDAGTALDDPTIITTARRVADAVLARLGPPDDLKRTADGDVVRGPAFLDDHAMLADGLLALHSATGDARWLDTALALVAAARRRFLDESTGVWFETEADRPDLLVRTCQVIDGAVPSGGGTMLRVLADLAERTGDSRHLDDLERFLGAVSHTIREHPAGAIRAVLACRTLARLAPERAARLAARPAPPSAPVPAVDAAPEAAAPDPDRGDDGVHARLHPEHSPLSMILRLSVPAGSHILAHDQPDTDSALSRLEIVSVEGGTAEADWPAGRRWRDGLRIHTGLVEVPLRLRRDDPSRSVVLVVRWQTCDDRRCFRPREMEFAIRPDAWPGETGVDPS